jgi:hypothetical protein
MKQKKLVKQVYKACLDQDQEKLAQLRLEEYKKIFKRKSKNKGFDASWTLIRV